MEDRPIAVYNTEVPELIALFTDKQVLIKYIVGTGECSKEQISNHVNKSIVNAGKVRKTSTPLNLSLAFRYASPEYIELLYGKDYILFVDYIPPVPRSALMSLTTTKAGHIHQMREMGKVFNPSLRASRQEQIGKRHKFRYKEGE